MLRLTQGLDNALALSSQGSINGPANWLICDLDLNIVHLSAMVSPHLQYPESDLVGRMVPDLVHRLWVALLLKVGSSPI